MDSKKIKERPENFYNERLSKMVESEGKYASLYLSAIKIIPFDENPMILDIGCGAGSFTKYIFEKGYKNYKGIDFAEDLLNFARKRFPTFKFIKGNLTDENVLKKFKDFSLFVSFEVLEHIIEDLKIVEAIPSGKIFIFSVPNIPDNVHVRWFSNLKEVVKRYQHLLIFDKTNMFDLIKEGKPHHHLFLFKTVRK